MNNDEYLELRSQVLKFIRLFGFLEQNKTPCGYSLSVSQVITMQELEHETLSIKQLADRLRLEKSSVSRLVDSLVKEGFVSRETNESNRREVLLSLTDKGRNANNNVRAQSLSYYQSILKDLSAQERSQILLGMQLFTSSLEKAGDQQNESI